MKRVKRDRCGYSGYACAGGFSGSLGSAFATISMVLDTQVDRMASLPIDDTADYIDNYLNIPVKVRGTVTTTNHIIDTEAADPQAPEVSCPDNDDASLMSLYRTTYEDIIDHKMTAHDSSYKLLKTNMPFCTRLTRYATSALPVPEDDEYTLDPGVLEPMLSTAFSPVGLDVPPTNINAVMFTLVQLTKWRLKVDARLISLTSAIKHVYGIRSLLIAAQKNSHCDDFKIRLETGSPIQWGSGNFSPPTYSIDGGTVHLNGLDIKISGRGLLKPNFYMYINVSSDGETADGVTIFSVSMSTKRGGLYSVGLGGVRAVAVKKRGSVPTYVMYQIVQETCNVDITLVHTGTDGVLGWSGQSANKVFKTAECPD